MAKKKYSVRWQLDVPRMVVQLGAPRAQQLWDQSKTRKEIRGNRMFIRSDGSTVSEIPGRRMRIAGRDQPYKVVRGHSIVEFEGGQSVDRSAIPSEIEPFINYDYQEIGEEEETASQIESAIQEYGRETASE